MSQAKQPGIAKQTNKAEIRQPAQIQQVPELLSMRGQNPAVIRRALSDPRALNAAKIAYLQRTVGNQGLGQFDISTNIRKRPDANSTNNPVRIQRDNTHPSEVQQTGNDSWPHRAMKFRKLMQSGKASKPDLANALGPLIQQAASGVTIPSSLPQMDVHPWLNFTSRAEWAGLTCPHLAFCFPNNCWRWLVFNQHTISTTLAWTQQAILHELLHATDVWRAAQEYMRLHGRPPANRQQNRCQPVEGGVQQGWQDKWGKYINNFIAFYKGELAPIRHEKIYGEAADPYFGRMSAEEKLVWFENALDNISPNLPSDQSFKVEQIILRLFRTPTSQQQRLREDLATKLVHVTFNLADGDIGDLGKAVSLLGHFDSVWRTRRQERVIILQMLRRNMEQIQSSNASSLPSQSVIQRQHGPQGHRNKRTPIVEDVEMEIEMSRGRDPGVPGSRSVGHARGWAYGLSPAEVLNLQSQYDSRSDIPYDAVRCGAAALLGAAIAQGAGGITNLIERLKRDIEHRSANRAVLLPLETQKAKIATIHFNWHFNPGPNWNKTVNVRDVHPFTFDQLSWLQALVYVQYVGKAGGGMNDQDIQNMVTGMAGRTASTSGGTGNYQQPGSFDRLWQMIQHNNHEVFQRFIAENAIGRLQPGQSILLDIMQLHEDQPGEWVTKGHAVTLSNVKGTLQIYNPEMTLVPAAAFAYLPQELRSLRGVSLSGKHLAKPDHATEPNVFGLTLGLVTKELSSSIHI